MSHASYVAAGYAVTFGSLAAYSLWVLLRGRRLSAGLPPDHRRWLWAPPRRGGGPDPG